MVHADVKVAGLNKFHQAGAEDFKFLHAFRQMSGEGALLLFEPRDMRIAEQRDTVGLQLKNLVYSVAKTFRRLIRQTINEIDVDAVEVQVTRGEQQVARQFERLDSVDGHLHLGMEILDAHAEAVKAQATQGFKVFASGYPRVDFNADFRVRRKFKMHPRESEQILKLLRSQICRGTAAPVELHYRAIARNSSCHLFDFALEYIEIRYGDAFVFLNNYVASAKKTQAFAEGKMHVQRNGCLGPLRFGVDGFEIIRTERVIPDWRR